MSLAIVLSGGGASGDFEVGAVELFYERGFRPDIVVGTSVGALAAAKLSEGEGAASQGSSGLKQIWLSLLYDSDMWAQEPWLSEVDSRFRDAIVTGAMPSISAPQGPGAQWGDAGKILTWIGEAAFLVTDGAAILQALGKLIGARSFFNLQPTLNRATGMLNQNLVNAWAATGKKLRLVTVNLETARLRYVTESGKVVEEDGTTPVQFVNAMTPAVIQAKDTLAQLEDQLADLQDQIRSTPGDKTGLAAQIRALQSQIVTAKANLASAEQQAGLAPLSVPLAIGAVASSSIGAIFAPTMMGDGQYVDGGHRRQLPLKAAVDLGASQIFAVIATPPDFNAPSLEDPTPGTESFGQKHILDIASRALIDVPLDQMLHDNLLPGAGFTGQLKTVAPNISLHGMLTIDPGLIRINMDYGYMRAADTLDNFDRKSPTGLLVDQITLLRGQLWRAECVLLGKPIPTAPGVDTSIPQPATYGALTDTAASLAALVQQRRDAGRPLPARSVNWGKTWEKHPWLVQCTDAPVTAISPKTDELLVVGVTDEGGANGRLMFADWNPPTGWQGWNPLQFGYAPSNSFVGTAAADGVANVFYVGSDGWVLRKWRDPSGNWQPLWVVGSSNAGGLQGVPGGAVHAVSCQKGTLHVFYSNASGHIIVARMDNAPDGNWGEHTGLLGGVTRAGGHVTAVSRRPGQVDVFTVGTDGGIFTAAWNPVNGWAGWWRIPGITSKAGAYIGAVSVGLDLIDLFVADINGATMSTSWSPSTGWKPWIRVQGGLTTPGNTITAVSRSAGMVDIFTTGTDGKICTAARNASGTWGGWWTINNAISVSAIWPVSRSTNFLDIFFVGLDRFVYTAGWQPGGAWGGPWLINQRWDLHA